MTSESRVSPRVQAADYFAASTGDPALAVHLTPDAQLAATTISP